MKLSDNFDSKEFACRCCGELPPDGMDPNLIHVLENIRHLLGDRPITVLSGYRCPKHNAAVGGAKSSQHMLGTAADIRCEGVSIGDIATAAGEVLGGKGGIGKYPKQGFVHVDVRRNRARWLG